LELRLKDNDKPLEIEKFFDIEKPIEETATEKNWNEMSSQFWLLRTWNLIKTIEEPILRRLSKVILRNCGTNF